LDPCFASVVRPLARRSPPLAMTPARTEPRPARRWRRARVRTVTAGRRHLWTSASLSRLHGLHILGHAPRGCCRGRSGGHRHAPSWPCPRWRGKELPIPLRLPRSSRKVPPCTSRQRRGPGCPGRPGGSRPCRPPARVGPSGSRRRQPSRCTRGRHSGHPRYQPTAGRSCPASPG